MDVGGKGRTRPVVLPKLVPRRPVVGLEIEGVVENGQAVSAGAYAGEDLNWDMRCAKGDWEKWLNTLRLDW